MTDERALTRASAEPAPTGDSGGVQGDPGGPGPAPQPGGVAASALRPGRRVARITRQLIEEVFRRGTRCAHPTNVPADLRILEARLLGDQPYFEVLCSSREFAGGEESTLDSAELWTPSFHRPHSE